MEERFCYGCMTAKKQEPVCEHCGYDERQLNLIHQLPIGTILQGQYVIGRVLGQGGFGITYIGWDTKLQRKVAVKEYFPNGFVQRNVANGYTVNFYKEEYSEVILKHRERFLKEARSLAQFAGTPEVVQVLNFFEENKTAYIVMEYVNGITLKKYLQNLGRPMTADEVLKIMEPVVRALGKIHEKHLVHRDISPDNIMVLPDGGIKLIDFGTARFVDGGENTHSTEAVLKHGFAPLEQYNTRGNIGTWTDVYALCATFYFCMVGKLPPDAPSRIEDGEALPLLKEVPGISAGLIEGLEKGMTIRIADRVQSVEHLHTIIYDPKQKKTKPPVEKKPESSEKTKVWPKLAFGVALLALALAAGSFFLQGQSAKEPLSPQVQASGQTTEAFATETELTTAEDIPEITGDDPGIAEAYAPAVTGPEVTPGVIPSGKFVRTEIDDGYEFMADRLYMRITDDREFQVTMTGLTIEDSYLVNWEGARENTSAYMWTVSLISDVTYEVTTVYWNFDPGKNEHVTIDNMDHCLYMFNESTGSFEYVQEDNGSYGSAIRSMTHTDDSITWQGRIPDSYSFDVLGIEQIDIRFSDEYKRENNNQSYYLLQ